MIFLIHVVFQKTACVVTTFLYINPRFIPYSTLRYLKTSQQTNKCLNSITKVLYLALNKTFVSSNFWKLLRTRKWIHNSLQLFRIAFSSNCSKLLRMWSYFDENGNLESAIQSKKLFLRSHMNLQQSLVWTVYNTIFSKKCLYREIHGIYYTKNIISGR